MSSRMRGLLGPYAILRGHRDLSLLFIAQVLSSFIDWLYVVALFAVAYSLTHTATTVALLTFTRVLPYAVLVPISGAITDRVDRRVLMVGAHLGRALCLFGLIAVQSQRLLPLAFVLVFLATLLSSLFRPAILASLPAVAGERELVEVNSLMSQIDLVALGAGPALAGVILLVGTPQVAFLISGIGLLLAALAVFLARVPGHGDKEVADSAGWVSHLHAGFRFLARENEGALFGIVLTLAGFGLENGAFWAITVDLSQRTFHLGNQGVGFLSAAYAVGGLLTGWVVGSVVIRRDITGLFIAGAAASSLALAGYGVSPAGLLPFLCLFIVGVADVFAKVIATTAIQTATPPQLLGRVFGANESLSMFATVLGSLIVGPLINGVGVRAADVLVSAAGLLLLGMSLPRLLRLERVLGIRIFLRSVPILNLISFRLLDDLVGRLRLERFPPGQIIIREGERGDRMFILKHGAVDVVTHGDDGREVPITRRSRLEYFGEIALLRDVPRTATVRARSAVEAFSLGREDFEQLRAQSEEFDRALHEESDVRYRRRQIALVPLA